MALVGVLGDAVAGDAAAATAAAAAVGEFRLDFRNTPRARNLLNVLLTTLDFPLQIGATWISRRCGGVRSGVQSSKTEEESGLRAFDKGQRRVETVRQDKQKLTLQIPCEQTRWTEMVLRQFRSLGASRVPAVL